MRRKLPLLFYRSILTFFFGSVIAIPVYSQQLIATANESEIGINDFVQITFRLENGSGKINPPSFHNFEIINGPFQESSITSINGKTEQSISLRYILHPLKTGTLAIEPATIIVNGISVSSNPLRIKVSNKSHLNQGNTAPSPNFGFNSAPPSAPQAGSLNDFILHPNENGEEKIKKNIIIRLDANKTECYVGQPIVVSFKLYTRLRSETNITDAPSFNGFSVSDMPLTGEATEEKIDGRSFNCYTLRKVQLFPLQAGTFDLTPIQATNRVTFLKSNTNKTEITDPFLQMLQDFSDDNLPSDETISKVADIKSNALTIHVKPLPDASIPHSFKGAVGKFTIQSDLQKEHLTTDDAGVLQITIEGEGNLSLITAPEVKWPAGVDVYDIKTKENINKNDAPTSGNKVFSIPFSISHAGNYTLPPIHFSWFNPQSGSYDSAQTASISFTVKKGPGIANQTNHLKENTNTLFSPNLLKTGGMVLAGGLLLVFVFATTRKRKKLQPPVIIAPPGKSSEPNACCSSFEMPGNPLEEACELMHKGAADAFYKKIEQSIRQYLIVKLHIPEFDYSRQTVLEKMDACNVGIGSTQLFQSVMNELETGLYAKNFQANRMKELYEQTAELVSLLNKQIC